jgi:hypothetical protein
LRKEVFLSYDAALDLIDDLEKSELNINPPEAETLASTLVNESAA